MDVQGYQERLSETASWIQARVKRLPRVAVILSAGLQGFAQGLDDAVSFASSEIPHLPQPKAEGHAGTMTFGMMGEMPVVAMAGRFHLYEGHAPHDVVFVPFVLQALGVETLIVTNAAGGIHRDFLPGDLMLITDHLNFMGLNPLAGLTVMRSEDQFTNMIDAYDVDLQALARDVAQQEQIPLREGVYLGVMGPSYETRAEIRAFRSFGADAVGMSTIPEVIAARFLRMRVLGFSGIANRAADLHAGDLSHAEVLENMQALSEKMVRLLRGCVQQL